MDSYNKRVSDVSLTPEVSSAEAVQKTKEAAEAAARANKEQIEAANIESEKRMLSAFSGAIKDAFKDETNPNGEQRFIDTARIPLICKDIANIKEDVNDIRADIKKGVWIIIGAVLLGLLAQILKT